MNYKYLIILFCFFILVSLDIKAQGFVLDSLHYGPDTVYTTPDASAIFPGGKTRMYDYIKLKFDMYADAMSMTGGPKEGSMDANFVVEATGKVKYVVIGNSLSPVYDEEMIRALTTMPKWEPAVVNGRKVRSLQMLRYSLNFYQR